MSVLAGVSAMTDADCYTCPDPSIPGAALDFPDEAPCPASRVDCGHHCNHSWTHDRCCWCQREWGEDGKTWIGGAR